MDNLLPPRPSRERRLALTALPHAMPAALKAGTLLWLAGLLAWPETITFFAHPVGKDEIVTLRRDFSLYTVCTGYCRIQVRDADRGHSLPHLFRAYPPSEWLELLPEHTMPWWDR